MLTVPSVCFLTSSANAMAFWVWKLPSGHTVDKSQLAVAAVARVERWPAASIVAAPAVKVRRVIIRPLLLLKSKRMPPPDASAHETVTRNRILVRHQAAFDVVANAFRRALPWLADPGTARRHHHKPIVRRHGLKALAAQLLSRLQSDIAGFAVTAAISAAGRMVYAVEGRQNVERSIDAAADFDDLAETTARAAGAARIRTQLLAPEDQRRLRLRDLDRRAAHAAGIGGGRQPILGKTCAGGAIARHRHGESVTAAGAAARLCAHTEIPQAGCAFGRHPLGNDLTEAAEDDVRQHLADDMTRRHRRRLRRVEYRARGSRHGQRQQRACVGWDLGGDHAAKAGHG